MKNTESEYFLKLPYYSEMNFMAFLCRNSKILRNNKGRKTNLHPLLFEN